MGGFRVSTAETAVLSQEDDLSEENTMTDATEVEQLRAALKAANAEAAKYRVERNEARDKTASVEKEAEATSKHLQELEDKLGAFESDAAAARRTVDSLKAAIAVGVDAERVEKFAGLLQGDSFDELVSHAEELKQLFHNDAEDTRDRATDATQGHGSPQTLPLNGDRLLSQVLKTINR